MIKNSNQLISAKESLVGLNAMLKDLNEGKLDVEEDLKDYQRGYFLSEIKRFEDEIGEYELNN